MFLGHTKTIIAWNGKINRLAGWQSTGAPIMQPPFKLVDVMLRTHCCIYIAIQTSHATNFAYTFNVYVHSEGSYSIHRGIPITLEHTQPIYIHGQNEWLLYTRHVCARTRNVYMWLFRGFVDAASYTYTDSVSYIIYCYTLYTIIRVHLVRRVFYYICNSNPPSKHTAMWYVVRKVHFANHLHGIAASLHPLDHHNHPQNISLMDIILNAMQALYTLACWIFLQPSSGA